MLICLTGADIEFCKRKGTLSDGKLNSDRRSHETMTERGSGAGAQGVSCERTLTSSTELEF